jgi:hypothetical protein
MEVTARWRHAANPEEGMAPGAKLDFIPAQLNNLSLLCRNGLEQGEFP